MKLHYSGPLDRVSIPLPGGLGREAQVAKGHDIDLRDEEWGLKASEADALGRSLITEDGGFTAVEDDTSTKKKEG